MEKCLVCGKKKISNSAIRCKMCGMPAENESVKLNNFTFCCAECRDRFKIMLKNAEEREKQKLLDKEIAL